MPDIRGSTPRSRTLAVNTWWANTPRPAGGWTLPPRSLQYSAEGRESAAAMPAAEHFEIAASEVLGSLRVHRRGGRCRCSRARSSRTGGINRFVRHALWWIMARPKARSTAAFIDHRAALGIFFDSQLFAVLGVRCRIPTASQQFTGGAMARGDQAAAERRWDQEPPGDDQLRVALSEIKPFMGSPTLPADRDRVAVPVGGAQLPGLEPIPLPNTGWPGTALPVNDLVSPAYLLWSVAYTGCRSAAHRDSLDQLGIRFVDCRAPHGQTSDPHG